MESKAGHSKIPAAVLMTALLGFLLVAPGPTLPQTPFFQGKTITVVQGRDPGGTGDLRVRALVPFLQKHIPGNPTIVSEYCRAVEAERRRTISFDQRLLMGSRWET